jgi:predicted metal-dependent phosphoesterase TrpH
MFKTDLHIHYEHSLDGELRVRDGLNARKHANLSVISITDHNMVETLRNLKGPWRRV